MRKLLFVFFFVSAVAEAESAPRDATIPDISCCNVDCLVMPHEPNDSLPTSIFLSDGDVFQKTVCNYDWFAFTVPEWQGALLTVDVTHGHELDIQTYCDEGYECLEYTYILRTQDGMFQINVPLVPTETRYYISIRSNVSCECEPPEYEIGLELQAGGLCMGEQDEPNDELATATSLNYGFHFASLCWGDEDYYSLISNAEIRYKIYVQNGGGLNCTFTDENGGYIPVGTETDYYDKSCSREFHFGQEQRLILRVERNYTPIEIYPYVIYYDRVEQTTDDGGTNTLDSSYLNPTETDDCRNCSGYSEGSHVWCLLLLVLGLTRRCSGTAGPQ